MVETDEIYKNTRFRDRIYTYTRPIETVIDYNYRQINGDIPHCKYV